MASISSAGVGSGLDVATLVSQLMQVERQPISQIESKQKSFQAKISALGSITSGLSSIKTTALSLSKVSAFKATSADTNVLGTSLSGTPGLNTTAGSYNIQVSRLADFGKVATLGTNWATNDDTKTHLQAGTLTFTVGKVADNGTAAGDRDSATAADWTFTTQQTVTVNFAGGTLANLRDAINNAVDGTGKTLGVSAQIVSGSSGAQLVFSSRNSGMDNAFKISGSLNVSTNNKSSYSPYNFAYDVTSNAYASAATGLKELSIPWSAQIAIDGIQASSNTNVFTDTIPGITLTAKQLSASGGASLTPTQVTVGTDADSVKTKLNEFITAFNNLKTTISNNTKYDQDNKKAATLTGDSAVRQLQQALAKAITSTPSGTSGTYSKLSEVGLTLGADGKLSLDASKLEAALNKDVSSVQSLLSAYGTAISNTAKSATESGGVISNRTDGINKILTRYGKDIETLERRMTQIEARLKKQFSSLDSVVSGMKSTSSYLSQQFG